MIAFSWCPTYVSDDDQLIAHRAGPGHFVAQLDGAQIEDGTGGQLTSQVHLFEDGSITCYYHTLDAPEAVVIGYQNGDGTSGACSNDTTAQAQALGQF